MQLLTKELIDIFAKVGRQDRDPYIIAKFFNPAGAGTRYATEYYPEDQVFFGYVTGLAEDERGTFSLEELQSYKGPFGLGIERDLYFEPKSFYTLFPNLKPTCQQEQTSSAILAKEMAQ